MNNLQGMAWFRLPVSGVVRHGMEGQGKASTGAGHARALCGSAGLGSARHGAK